MIPKRVLWYHIYVSLSAPATAKHDDMLSLYASRRIAAGRDENINEYTRREIYDAADIKAYCELIDFKKSRVYMYYSARIPLIWCFLAFFIRIVDDAPLPMPISRISREASLPRIEMKMQQRRYKSKYGQCRYALAALRRCYRALLCITRPHIFLEKYGPSFAASMTLSLVKEGNTWINIEIIEAALNTIRWFWSAYYGRIITGI